MNLKQVVVNNGGMSQDLSISKQDNKFAFENKNIRIQSTDDGTLLSVTNIKGPALTKTILGCERVLGSCVTPDYLVIFGKYDKKVGDLPKSFIIIYRIDLNEVDSAENACKILYDQQNIGDGALNIDISSFIDTLYYEEGEYVKKVYWTDGKNNPRVINLVTPGERVSEGKIFTPYETNVFEFYPNIYAKEKIPEVTVTKNRNVASQLPSGVVQYFISYYNVNGAETLIANSSDLYTIDYSDRGANADESGVCAFDIEIPASNVNINFDYIRVYSAIRTTYDGPLTVKIVGDIKITKDAVWAQDGVYKITDTGINQEQLQDNYIYFIGGTPFIAKTLSEKDGTAFFGNISTENVNIPDELRDLINEECFEEDEITSKQIEFSLTKNIPNNEVFVNQKYPYQLQNTSSIDSYRTFKSGETYRFGIQFQNKKGQWTNVSWVGDTECIDKPLYDNSTKSFKVNDASFSLPISIRDFARNYGYVNYRILYADPETSNGRKIKAQGILCPTLFTPGKRALNAPYSIPSWVMRPVGGKAAYHHFEPIFSSEVEGGEIAGFAPKMLSGEQNAKYPQPYVEGTEDIDNKYSYIVTYIAITGSGLFVARSVKLTANASTPYETLVNNHFYESSLTSANMPVPDISDGANTAFCKYEVLCDYVVPYSNFDEALDAKGRDGNNPYGFIGKRTFDNKEYYTYYQSTLGDDTGGVIGLRQAFNNLNLDSGWLPDVEWLNSEKSIIARSGKSTFEDFAKYPDEFFMRRTLNHIDDAKGNLKEMQLQNYIPLYSRSARIPVLDKHQPIYLPGSVYANLGNLDNFEDTIFAPKATRFEIISDIYNFYFRGKTIPEIFRPHATATQFKTNQDGLYYKHYGAYSPGGTWNYIAGYIQVIPLKYANSYTKEIKDSAHDYFVDESILTFNSPDLNSMSDNVENIKFKIIGVAPLNNAVSKFDSTINKYASVIEGGLDRDVIKKYDSINTTPFYSDYLYDDYAWESPGEVLSTINLGTYKAYLFSANNYIGITNSSELEPLYGEGYEGEFPGIIQKQQILNQWFSPFIKYTEECDYGEVFGKKLLLDSENVSFKIGEDYGLYYSSYDDTIINESTPHLYKTIDYGEQVYNKLSAGNTRVKFSQTEHFLINLQDKNNSLHKYILPHIVNTEFEESNNYFRDVIDGKVNVFSGDTGRQSGDSWFLVSNSDREEWKQNSKEFTSPVISKWDNYINDGNYLVYIQSNDSDIEHPDESNYEQTLINEIQRVINSNYFQNVLKYYNAEEDSDTIIYNYTGNQNKILVYILSYNYNLITSKYTVKGHKKLLQNFTINSTDLHYGEVSAFTLTDYEEGDDESAVYFMDVEDLPTVSKFPLLSGEFDSLSKEDLGYPIINYFPVLYTSKKIIDDSLPSDCYLFVGELYNDIDKESLYGGTEKSALRALNWIPASSIKSIEEDVSTMAGDTFYQRWDCLKTYPTTEEDVNQIVDITSFMLETHKNLDLRTDKLRAKYNVMSRPSNFNIFNSVYDQKNNIFTYTVNWEEMQSEKIPNQIVWSSTKNYLGDVDSWTNTNITSSTRVKYPVTKLVNFNNNILALTEHSLELVNFNSKQLVPSTDNTFIELQNSTKVNGTTKLQYPYGTHNMSTLITEQGLYFIEDNEKSLIRLGGEEGISKIGITEMLEWFHRNIVQGTYVSTNHTPFRLEYDPIHKDLYIINNEYQIVYNENLKAFTSFITYSGEYWLYNYNGKLYAYNFDSNNHSLGVFEMFSNEKYNIDFSKIEWDSESGEWEVLEPEVLDYSVWYRINPNPYSDKVFTNGVIMADLGTVGTDVKMPNSNKSLNPPFEYVRAWTEYQDTGYVKLEHILDKPSTLKQKFRYWRFNIPRDTNSPMKRDRIRNPWIHIQMTGNSTEKMEFHNLSIQYME